MKIIDQLKFKLMGRAFPIIRVSEVDAEKGLIRSMHLVGVVRDDDNRLVRPWDNKAWEKSADAKPINLIDEKGIEKQCWLVSERGETVNIYTRPWEGPRYEGVLGALATVDSIRDAMGLNPSMRDKIIFMVVGILLGWLIFGPMITKILS